MAVWPLEFVTLNLEGCLEKLILLIFRQVNIRIRIFMSLYKLIVTNNVSKILIPIMCVIFYFGKRFFETIYNKKFVLL